MTVLVNKYNGARAGLYSGLHYSPLTGISCIIPLLQWPVTRHTEAFDAFHPWQCIMGENKQTDGRLTGRFYHSNILEDKIEFPN